MKWKMSWFTWFFYFYKGQSPMKKILTVLLISAALTPTFSYSYEVRDVCAENVTIDSISVPDNNSRDKSWSISYTLSTDQTYKIISDREGKINIDTAQGRATYALAMNAMNMKQPVKIIDLKYNNNGDRCYDFNMLMVGDIE